MQQQLIYSQDLCTCDVMRWGEGEARLGEGKLLCIQYGWTSDAGEDRFSA